MNPYSIISITASFICIILAQLLHFPVLAMALVAVWCVADYSYVNIYRTMVNQVWAFVIPLIVVLLGDLVAVSTDGWTSHIRMLFLIILVILI